MHNLILTMKIDQTKKIWQKKSIRYQKYGRRVMLCSALYIVFYNLYVRPFDEIAKQTFQMPTLEDKAVISLKQNMDLLRAKIFGVPDDS